MRWPWLFLCLVFSFPILAAERLEFFFGKDCSKCEHAQAALVAYQGKNPDLEIIGRDVTEGRDHLNRLRFIGLKEGFENLAIPAFYYHSNLKAGMADPSELLKWLDETKKSSLRSDEITMMGVQISFKKSGALVFSVILALKDFFTSVWGLALILFSFFLVYFGKRRLDAMIGALSFSLGAISSSLLWNYPGTRIFFGQVFMLDSFIAIVIFCVALLMILKTKKYNLSGWMELGLFSLGSVGQRLTTVFSGFELLRLQDVLLEAGASNTQQLGMNIVYGLIQFFLMSGLIAFMSFFHRKTSAVAKIS